MLRAIIVAISYIAILGNADAQTTLTNSNCGKTVSAAGGSFYVIKVSGSFPIDCRITIFNADPIPDGVTATGAKFVNFVNCSTGQSGSYIWPQRAIQIEYTGSSWIATQCPDLWMMPVGIFTINVDPSNGSDVWGEADGLATGSRAFASTSDALNQMANLMIANFTGATRTVIKLCASCADSTQIHWPPHGSAPTNSSGGAGVTLDCNGGVITKQLELFFSGAILLVQNCKFTGGISVNRGAEFMIAGAGNQFQPVNGGYVFFVALGGKISDYTLGGQTNILGGTGAGLINVSGSSYVQLPSNIQQVGDQTWTDGVVRIQSNSFVSIPSWGVNGYSTIGTRLNILECGVIEGVSNLQGSGIKASGCYEIH